MDEVGGARPRWVTGAQPVVDVTVTVLGRLDRAALGDRAPEPGANRPSREVLDQGGQRRVAGGRDDDAVELLVRCDERLLLLRRIHLRQTSLERLEVLLAQPARRQPGRDRLE